MSNFTEVTSENLREIREFKGHTQDQVAEVLRLKKSNISHIETGRRALSDTEKQILEWYFLGKIPPRLAAPESDARGVLEFSEAEWRMIEICTKRDGSESPRKWIAAQIRSTLGFRHALGEFEANSSHSITSSAPTGHHAKARKAGNTGKT